MKKAVYFALAAVLLVSLFSACGGKSAGKLVCGVTEYEPMNYRDARGNWTGFDTEFALLVGQKLGLEVQFQLIDWSNKFIELNSKSIDAIWNGFTATANESDGTPRMNLCDMSYSYMTNTQCVVIKSDRAAEFTSTDSLAGKTIAVEAGSAGESLAQELVGDNGRIVGAPAQINTFMEVKSGASDGAVIDVILARQITGSGDYTDLTIANISLGDEIYAIGFRRGDTLRNRVNQAMAELYDEGKLQEIARKYGLAERLVVDRNFGR
ncbi:MAG: transporter substrate-binding domain-containing protein [Treponema sp.]|nr:transporter substrate-binding domain-containing protein [Treponema sp.]MCL2181446.1 transporter substrate-binding domain-containing protein [Treponema sp.]